MLQGLLSIIVYLGWVLVSLAIVLRFIRTLRRKGIRIALQRLLSIRLLGPVLIVVALTVVKLSLVFVYPQQIGVVVSLTSPGGIRSQPLAAGLHWIVPLAERVVVYPIYWQTYTMASRPYEGDRPGADAIVARTLDSQEVTMDISIIYRIDAAQVVRLHIDWQDRYKDQLLRPSVRGFLRRLVAQYTVDEVNSNKRSDLERQLDADIKAVAHKNGLDVMEVLLRNIAFSPQYALSVERKQVALQGETQKIYEARQIQNLAKGKARKIEIVASAEAEAVRIKAKAKAEARVIQAEAEAKALELVAAALQGKAELLTYRYIEQLSPNVQAVVLPNDMPLIFPLPDMQPPRPELSATIPLWDAEMPTQAVSQQ